MPEPVPSCPRPRRRLAVVARPLPTLALLAGLVAAQQRPLPSRPVVAPVGVTPVEATAVPRPDLSADFELPEGLTVELWAESPLLFNPTALDVDAAGRLWVTEAVNYRQWNGRNPGRSHPEGDRVVVLEDSDGDGSADRSVVFAQDEDLVAPLGIAVLGDRVLVSCSPHLLEYRDTDGDLVADEKRVLLTGFGGFNHDHGLHSVVAGPDGRWLLAVGNAGPHRVTDADGWTLRSGSLYNGGGPELADNRPGLVSDDGRVWTGGLVLALDPDGGGLQVLAHNFRNNYEVAADSFGHLYQADNDDDGNRSCRTLWCLPGGDHGYFSPDGSRTWQADRRPGQETVAAHWHSEDPGVVPPGCINGAGGPTGVAVYEVGPLSPWLEGRVLNADAGAGIVYAHVPERTGSGVTLAPGWLIRPRADRAGESAAWFRPSDVVVGTEGAVYVADWYDPGVGGHLARDGQAYGRILRIRPTDQRLVAPPAPDTDSTAGAVAALLSPAVNLRAAGRATLLALGAEAAPAVEQLTRSPLAPYAARATWLLARLGPWGRHRVEQLLRRGDVDRQVTALRALAAAGRPPLELVRLVLEELDAPAPALLREAALLLVDVPDEVVVPAWLDLAERYTAGDRYLLECLGLAARGRESLLHAALAAADPRAPDRWGRARAELTWRLHPPEAVDDLVARAADPTLTATSRRLALEALAFQPDRAAAEAVLTLALAGSDDLAEQARWWVRHRDGNLWRDHDLARHVAAGSLDAAEERFRSEVIRSGLHPVDVDVSDASLLWLVVEDGGDGNSCDWADWIDAKVVHPLGDKRLGQLAFRQAEAAWGQVTVDANCVGDPLTVDGKAYRRGVGTHASSVIAVAVPDGALRFTALVGPDDGGTRQGDPAPTSLVFRVLVESKADELDLQRQTWAVLDGAEDIEFRVEAAEHLVAHPQGALTLLELERQGRLPPELREVVVEGIWRNPDLGVRSLAEGLFERPGASGRPAPTVAGVLALEGDPRAGRAVFDGAVARCSTCHVFEGRGGDVGPDLTSIREKYARPALLDAILNPSAAIAIGYDTWLLTLADGRLLSGFLLSDGETIVVKDTQGQRHVLAAADVRERRQLALSSMPEGVAHDLTPQQLADLAAFLLRDTTSAPRLGEPVALFDGESLDGWVPVLPDGGDPAATWSVRDGVLRCEGRPIGYLRTAERYTDFELTLRWRFDPAAGSGNSGVLLRVQEPDEVWPRSIEAQLHSRNAGDLWNIQAFGMDADPGRTSGRRTLKRLPSNERPLGEWNDYRIRLDGGELTVAVNGEVQNRARWCEELPGFLALQSEGAVIEFRDIVLRPLLRD